MKEYNLSTSRGKKLYDMGCKCCWYSLSNVYDKWSKEKEKAFNWCFDQYCKDENSEGFGIGNANSYGFTASWLLTKDGEDCMRVQTKNNSYLIWLER